MPAQIVSVGSYVPPRIMTNDELATIIHANDDGRFPGLASHVVKGLYRVAGGGEALRVALDAIFEEVSAAIERGARARHQRLEPRG